VQEVSTGEVEAAGGKSGIRLADVVLSLPVLFCVRISGNLS
jgi:hypothetical protein